eukprot:TRINITY_DN68334_c0_g1_i1.p1 TRINITY_DN68334_c0_g1~~TRINITY_DN68334_c0_g1_i1.p1  ORF type:complete len:737 (+),score=396.19 TRINITY_DN68334_c0_g1_i1:45-2255(+)
MMINNKIRVVAAVLLACVCLTAEAAVESNPTEVDSMVNSMVVLPLDQLLSTLPVAVRSKAVAYMQLCVKHVSRNGDRIRVEHNDYPVCRFFEENYPDFATGVGAIDLQKYPDERTQQLMEEAGESVMAKYMTVLKKGGVGAFNAFMENVYKQAQVVTVLQEEDYKEHGRTTPTYEDVERAFEVWRVMVTGWMENLESVRKIVVSKLDKLLRPVGLFPLRRQQQQLQKQEHQKGRRQQEQRGGEESTDEESTGSLVETEAENPVTINVRKWPNAVVEYYLDPDLPTAIAANFEGAVGWWASKTCIRFRRVYDIRDRKGVIRVFQSASNACSSYVGRSSSVNQPMELSAWCKKAEIAHEIGHALGMHHTHTRKDRDDFVTVHMDNMKEGLDVNFKKQRSLRTLVDYDYGSIMHYCARCGSKDPNKDVITPKKEGVKIGQRERLSDLDAKQMNLLYKCLPKYDRCEEKGRQLTPTKMCVAPGPEGQVCLHSSECHWKSPHCVDNVCSSTSARSASTKKKKSVDLKYTGDRAPRPATHTVTEKDFGHMLTVADRYHGDVDDFYAFNGMAPNTKLKVGDVIKLPPYGWKKGDPMPTTNKPTTTTNKPTTNKPAEPAEPTKPAQPQRRRTCRDRKHVVDEKDHRHLIFVATRYDVDLDELAALNGMRSSAQVAIGDIICLPKAKVVVKRPERPHIKYTCKGDDKLIRIAMKHNVDIKVLKEFNNFKSYTPYLRAGQVIKIPK